MWSRRFSLSSFFVALILMLLPACSDDGNGGESDTSSDISDETRAETDATTRDCGEGMSLDDDSGLCAVEVPEKECAENSYWDPENGQKAFEDVSKEWNLDMVNPSKIRMSVTDFNDDGWPDLIIRGSSRNKPDSRNVWLLENTGEGEFKDVTEESNFLANRVSPNKDRRVEIVAWGDVDNDGDLDAYTGFNKGSGSGQLEESAEIMLNQGDGTFELGPLENPVRRGGKPDRPMGASFIDYNLDGNLDLWVAQVKQGDTWNPRQDRLYKGNGDGTFEDVTEEVGLNTVSWNRSPFRGNGNLEAINQAKGASVAWGSAACDLNDDGYPELLASSYGRAPNHLFKAVPGEEGISYENISVKSGYAYDDRMDWSDNQFARCYCESNPNAEGCSDVPAPQIRCQRSWNHQLDREPFRLGGNSGTTVCADIDTDGRMDLLTTELRHWWAPTSSDRSEILYNNDGEQIKFNRPGREETGLTRPRELRSWNEGDQTAAVFDFDNDGRPDIYIGDTDYAGTWGRLWHQNKEGKFDYVPRDKGVNMPASHGTVFADFDRDGDMDLVVGHSTFACSNARGGTHCFEGENNHNRLFENKVGQDGNWIQLDLEGGEDTNRAAIGARVTVETQTGTQTQEKGGGHGQTGYQNDPVLHFGLASACEAEVTVRWPNKDLDKQTFILKSGYRYHLEQGESPTIVEKSNGE